MGVRTCPCKGCTAETGRNSQCHSTCKRYLEWRRELDEINAIKRKQTDMEVIMRNYKKYYN